MGVGTKSIDDDASLLRLLLRDGRDAMQMSAGRSLWFFDQRCNDGWTRWNRHRWHFNANDTYDGEEPVLMLFARRIDDGRKTESRPSRGSSPFRRRELHALKRTCENRNGCCVLIVLFLFPIDLQAANAVHSERLSSPLGLIEKTHYSYHRQASVSSAVNFNLQFGSV